MTCTKKRYLTTPSAPRIIEPQHLNKVTAGSESVVLAQATPNGGKICW